MIRVETRWSGGPMGAGLTVMNVGGAAEDAGELDDALAAVKAFWTALAFLVPSTVTMQVNNVVEVRNEGTGAIIASISGAVQSAVPGSGSGTYAGGVGARVRWTTGQTRNGRPVTGTTFVVPLVSAALENNGTLSGQTVTAFSTAASTLLGSLNSLTLPLGVWSRPTSQGAGDGLLNPVTGVVVPDQVAWLTTRRH
jgi:hypothetical protein